MLRSIPNRVKGISNIHNRFITTSRVSYQPRNFAASPTANTSKINPTLQKPPSLQQPTIEWKGNSSYPHIRYASPITFGILFSAGTFVTAGIAFDRNQQTLWDRLRQHTHHWSFFGSAAEESVLAELWRQKRDLLIEKRHALLERLAEQLNNMAFFPQDVKRAIWIVGEKIASLSEAEKTLSSLIAINAVVFGCWQIPRLLPFMSKWFLHLPGGRKNVTMLTSCFSHQELFHFAFNMIGLWSFGRVVHDSLGREQLVAMYLGMGVGANVFSHTLSLIMRRSRPLLPSLGASGAIYGLVAATAVLYPNSSISLLFLPMIPIKLGYALPALMAFDAAGIIFKWRMFDHFAHLSGAGLGLGYMMYGERYIWGPLVRKIHEIRTNSNNNRRGKKGGGNNGAFMLLESRQPEKIQSSKWPGWFKKD
ncbi:MAG: hypothetical protein EXX96DRAFT_572027 [Benjaminiella poitrasii]|nr:MAG: hypothetical protein EXX96DRAFT_572027 [Benjaminiella poitrasii]